MATVRFNGSKKFRNLMTLIKKADYDDAVERALYRVHYEVARQPDFPVDTGRLRRSGRVDRRGARLLWDDLDYAQYVEARQQFFGPIVGSKAGPIVKDEILRALSEAIEHG